ncbi:MAG: class I SAM-dependent methyltransferase [Candidatus Liptonbacteria bacterium]|nr:class I SAM-dependent methyltransferase [Candidatus Liptonbacteria bacterium]
MTYLETLTMEALDVKSLEVLQKLVRNDKEATQAKLDAATPRIMEMLSPEEINGHVLQVYDETCGAYVKTPHNQGIIGELIEFMDKLPDGAEVLDIGCGPGRDALFMALNDVDFRFSQMKRVQNGKMIINVHPIPTKTLKAYAMDNSIEMIGEAMGWRAELNNIAGKNYISKSRYPFFFLGDIYNDLSTYLPYGCKMGKFDGAWSCAALFTHTPKGMIDAALKNVSAALKNGGVFFTSYTTRPPETGGYDKLLISSTGRIKYFSHPTPDEIARPARKLGLKLTSESQNDIFVSQFYVKE